jgi:hypothetical protein
MLPAAAASIKSRVANCGFRSLVGLLPSVEELKLLGQFYTAGLAEATAAV